MDHELKLLRTELHHLMEKEAAALTRALQLRRSGDEHGSLQVLAEVDVIRVRRGEVQRRIREITGPPLPV